MIEISKEASADIDCIHEINLSCFETEAEARLVDRLRKVVNPFISLVAKDKDKIMGHILFTPVSVGDSKFKALGLGPMAVISEKRGEGIGSLLVAEGLRLSREMDYRAVFVLGEPDYYTRFGFVPASTKDIYYKNERFSPYFFMIELFPNALLGISGEVHYHPYFDEV